LVPEINPPNQPPAADKEEQQQSPRTTPIAAIL
jgi:hypothetical protein